MSPGADLSARQLLLTGSVGALLWFAAALLCGYLGPWGVFDGSSRVLLYLLVIPGSVPLVPLVGRVAGLARAQLGVGIAFATAVAAMLDGLALAWWPAIYGGPDHVAGAGAVILWGAGVVMMLGFVAAQRAG